jgi:hypothetical protein
MRWSITLLWVEAVLKGDEKGLLWIMFVQKYLSFFRCGKCLVANERE